LKAFAGDALLSDWVWDETLLVRISGDALERWIRYLYDAELDEESFEQRLETLHSASMKTKGRTLAQRLMDRGRQEGREEGTTEAIQRSILGFLEAKHGRVPEGLKEAIEEIRDLTRLEALIARAALSESLEQFAQGL
jgi:hypothetical protein